MKREIRSAGWSVALVAFLLIGFLPGNAMVASAQRAKSHTTADGSHQVSWEGDWKLNNSEVADGFDAETLFFTDDSSILSIGFFPSGFDLEEVRDAVLDGVSQGQTSGDVRVIDSGAYDNVAYELDIVKIEGIDFGIWVVVIDRGQANDMTVMVYGAPISQFSVGMTQAQADILIDGESVFEGIDPDGLQDLLGKSVASEGTSGSSSSTRSDSSTSSSSSRTQSFTSSSWLYTVEYEAPWDNAEGQLHAGEFAIYSTSPVAFVSFEGFSAEGIEPVLAFSAFSDAFKQNLPANATVTGQAVGQDRMIFVARVPEGVFAQEVIFLSGKAVIVTMISENGSESVRSLQSSVTINGMPIFGLWDSL